MSLSGVIADFKTHTLTVTRTAAGSYDSSGVIQAGSTTTFTIDACVQPAPGRMLHALPEGERGEETKLVLTTTALRTRASGGAADTTVIDGDTYKIVRISKVDAFGGDGDGDHYECLATKVSNP